MTRTVYILLLFIVCFNLAPREGFSCDVNTGKSLAEKHTFEKSPTKDCCSKHKNNTQDSEVYSGKCGESACPCPTFSVNPVMQFSQEKINKSFFISATKQLLFYQKTFVSKGFYAIWTPPNIS